MTETGLFDLSFEYRFESAHRFTMSCEDSCATPHGHTWYARALFTAPEAALGGDDMVLEFAKLKRSWKSFIQNTVDHSFMHHYEDPILPALQQHIPKFRGLPFPGDPTTELISVLFFAKLESMHQKVVSEVGAAASAIRPTEVLLRETPTNSVTYKAGMGRALLDRLNREFDGWWQSPEPGARNLRRR